ncbi:PrsW family intramembrane metalloprotease [uncultured Pseudokineococcus sp.]|uniref:PrsW family intramembrane metalloprotease n=1 Tax=uncultured Pseudokineococcus sp. TaxID=1642928 RepID=UPI00261C8B18|nr:PrsW family intramembrane metalloprotease [uncultured Pseudokineococcus sp.]
MTTDDRGTASEGGRDDGPDVREPGARTAARSSLAASPSPGAPAADRPATSTGLRRARDVLVAAVLALVMTAGLLRVLTIILAENGPSAVLVGLALALLPVLLVGAAFLWLDRFEAEPPGLLLLALGWGGGVATAIALAVNTQASLLLDPSGVPGPVSLGVVAPMTEELAKALGVVAVLVLRRREFDGVVDGVVYAGMVGIGFAFVENVLYFSGALVAGGTSQLAVTFVLRAVVSPFAHPLFTVVVGVGIGLAVSRRGRARWLLPVAGLLVAVVLHGLWNLSTFAPLGFPLVYLVLQVPVFAGVVLVAVLARRREGRVLREQLDVYARAGWVTPAEAAMVASLPERRRARRWARATGGAPAEEAMEELQNLAGELAFLRERLRRGTAHRGAQAEEQQLLSALWLLRQQLLPAPAPVSRPVGAGVAA